MPLAKISLDSVLGLTTERDDTSGINSPQWSSMSAWSQENASSGATSPNSLADCANIIISRNKQATARTAFVKVWDFTSTYGADPLFSTKGLYSIPNTSSDSNSLQFAWTNATDANIANFSDETDQEMESSVYYIAGIQSSDFSVMPGYYGLSPDFSWDPNASSFHIKSFNLARFSTSYSNIYIFSSNGVFRTTARYQPNVTVGNFNYYKRVTLPLVRALSASVNSSPALSNVWLNSGYLVDIKVLVVEQISSSQKYQGKPSRTLTVTNAGELSDILITFSIDNTNLILEDAGVEVYRTVSYPAVTVDTTQNVTVPTTPPVTFYKCWESALSAATSVSTSTSTFTDIELTLNDTSIQAFQRLYINSEAALTATLSESAESAAPPTAREVISYNNFTVYGNVMVPPFAPLTMTALPNTDGLDLLKVGATTVNITYIPNSITTPANTGVITTTSGSTAGTGTFSGVANNPNNATPTGGTGYNIVIRPQDPNAPASSTGTFSVPYFAIADKLELVAGGVDPTHDVKVTPEPGAMFDITRFPATGIIAVIKSVSNGYVIALFSYQSYEQDTAGGWYTFKDCLAYGCPFTDQTWTASGGNGLPTSGAYVVYPLLGTNITGLSVYAIGSTADPAKYNNEVGFSLEPTFEKLKPFNQTYVGNITALSFTASTAMAPYSPIKATINFYGIYAQQAGQLLDQCVRTLCDTYNTARLTEDPYAVYDDSSTAPAGRIRFESIYSGYNRKSAYAGNSLYTSGDFYYDEIKAASYRTVGTPTVKFAEPISGTSGSPSNIMQQSPQTIAGITISKYNKPEEIPISQNLQPYIIGDPLKPIIKLVNQYSQMLIFKQDEGTYKADVQGVGGQAVLPNLVSISLVDNTAWLLLPESVQVFEGTTVFFSNKAFVAISSAGQVSELSPMIATELLNNYSTIYANNAQDKVRSWIIAQQRLYCCYFPNINQDNTSSTYVFSFNTGQWTKWTGEIVDAVVSATGLLSVVDNIYEFAEPAYDTQQVNDYDISDNKYWSVLRQANFQNPSASQIEDTIPFTDLTVTYNTAGEYIKVTITGFNSTSVYGNIYDILMLYKNRTMWYLSAEFGYISAIFVNDPGVVNSVTLLLVNNIYDRQPVRFTNFTATVEDSLTTTVNTALFFNRFFIALPRGSTLSHFSEVQIYTQDQQEYSNIALGFNSTGQNPLYVVTSDGTKVVTTTGDPVVINSTPYEDFAPYSVLSASQYSFRAYIPRNASRGRFIQLAILHDTPEQIFRLNSIVYIYRDTNSTRIKAHTG